MSQSIEVMGELTDNRHVTLDEPIALTEGKVRLIVEVVPGGAKPDLAGFERILRERQKARGHVPPTKEEIDAYINAERDSWDS